MIRKNVFNYLSLASISITPVITVACQELRKGFYESYKNDFSIHQINSYSPYERMKTSSWGEEFRSLLINEGFYNWLDFGVFDTKNSNKFNDDFVENLFSSKRNEIGSNQSDPKNAAVHESVSLITDIDSSLMSIFYKEGHLKSIDDIYMDLNIFSINTDLNPHLLGIAVENSSVIVDGNKRQIGIPSEFSIASISFSDGFENNFKTLLNKGVFSESTINGVLVPQISNSSNPMKSLIDYIRANGWSWNEMIDITSVFIEEYPTYVPIRDINGLGLETFFSAKRYAKDGTLIWNGISDDWNSDIISELSKQNLITEVEAQLVVSKSMELSAPWTDDISRGENQVLTIRQGSSDNILPMPLYTNNGNDIYDDLVITSQSLYVPNDEEFFSSEKGVKFREHILELILLQTFNSQEIPLGNEIWISPYISTNKINSFMNIDRETDYLVSALLDNTDTYSIASTRWLSNWYRDSLINSTEWSGGENEREYSYEYNPIPSVDRNVKLYEQYNLNTK